MKEEINASHIDSLKLTLEELKNLNNKACQWLCFSVMRQLIMKRCQEFLKWLPKENLTIAREWLRVEAFSFSLVEMIIFSLTCVLNWVKIWVQSFPVGVVVVETETF